jgi:hypothetical protein
VPHWSWWKGNTPLADCFAEAYAWCARYSRIVSVGRYAMYHFGPTPAQHRNACALIKRVTARRRWSRATRHFASAARHDRRRSGRDPSAQATPTPAPRLPIATVAAIPR